MYTWQAAGLQCVALFPQRTPCPIFCSIRLCRIEVENFSGNSPLSVYQDVHAAVLSKSITAMLVADSG